MSLRINDTAPNFKADTTAGPIDFYDWMGDGWAVIFSHPKDFTPVCTTELGVMAGMMGDFAKRNAKILGISVDPVEDHNRWKSDIEAYSGNKVDYPMIGDPEMKVAKLYAMMPNTEQATGPRTPVQNQTVRTVYVVAPDKTVKLALTYPMSTGRNFDEILRALDSIQLTAKHAVSTPANWKPGEDIIIGGTVSDEDAKAKFGAFEQPLPYIRTARQPT